MLLSFPQVVVNLYPFRATVTRSPAPPFEEGVENIDIGGPAMIRAAAKNHGDVTVIVDPADYTELLAQLSSGGVSQDFRKKMAWKAYQHTASYDAQVGTCVLRQPLLHVAADLWSPRAGLHRVSKPIMPHQNHLHLR